jgi:hypothetical protein
MKNKFFLKAFCLIFYCVLSKNAFAQTSKQDPIDSQAWYSSKIRINLPKKWAISTDYQARFYNDFKTHYGSYFTFGAEKKLSKSLDVLAAYRLAFVEKGTYNRISIGAEAQQKWHNFEFSLRILAQKNWKNFSEVGKETKEENYWRTRFTAAYNMSKKTSFYVATEPIMQFGGDVFVDNLRNSIGLKVAITKQSRIDLFYLHNPDYSKSYKRLDHIMGIELNYTIDKKK